MSKILVEIYLPAAMNSYDLRIPDDMKLRDVTELAARALEQMAGPMYSASLHPVLCDRDSGNIFNGNRSAMELGLKNGSKLMLI